MRQSTYQSLPLEALLDLLIDGTKKLLFAYDLNDAGLNEFRAHKKYVECLIALIDEKKIERIKLV